jgi:hypothetical protein
MRWDEMSEQEKNALTAECMGWDRETIIAKIGEVGMTEESVISYVRPADHDAAAQVREEVKRRKIEEAFCDALAELLSPERNFAIYNSAIESQHPLTNGYDIAFALVNATPDQQAHAFVRACGKDV